METTLRVLAPFRLDLTANVLRRLSSNAVDTFDGTTYRRLFGGGEPAVLAVTQTAPAEMSVKLDGATAGQAQALATRMLGTSVELTGFTRAANGVPWLAAIVAGAAGVKPPRYPTVWEACVNAIVYQQISIHAAGAILRRIIERYTVPVCIEGVGLRAFPAPDIIADAELDELRALGLSINKIVAVRRVARAILEGELDEAVLADWPTPELTARLATLHGIGPWTAAVIALRGFGRLDLFPMNDSGVARSIRDLAGRADVDVPALLDRLGPQRGMLYYHLLLARLAARGDVELAATPAEL